MGYTCTLLLGSVSGLTQDNLESGTTNNTTIIADAIVTCNDPDGYTLLLKSINGSKFVNSSLSTAYSDYQIKVNDVLINISSPDQFQVVQVFPPGTEHTDQHFVSKITISGKGSGNIVDGNYSDAVTFRITPN